MKKTVVIGVTSGIAAYKCLELVTKLRKNGINLVVVMTKNATQMVQKSQFEKASGNKVYSELFESGFDYKTVLKKRVVDHIKLADSADLVVIAPATANTMAKIAHGIADDFLTTMLLATKAPVLLCPSMNVSMWENLVVQENLSKLQKRGYHILHPEEGALACGYTGVGRLANVLKIYNMVLELIEKKELLKNKKILITAGSTREPIDSVRFITNRSSGKMGAAIAAVCHLQGAEVLLLRAKNSVDPSVAIAQKTFETADDLESLIKQYAKKYDTCFHAAAVSDFSIKEKMNGKISSKSKYHIALTPREKILSSIKQWNKHMKVVGFKAVYGNIAKEIKPMQKRLVDEHVDAMVVNDISRSDTGFESDTNEVLYVTRETAKKFPLALKTSIAEQIVSYAFL